MLSNVRKKIKRILEENLDENLIEMLPEEFSEQIIMAIDSDVILEQIMLELNSHVFKFDSSAYGDDFCHTCQKRFCDFISIKGVKIQADDILKPGMEILLD